MSSAQAYSEHFQFRQPHEQQWNFQGDLATAIGLPLPNELMQLNRPLLTPMLASAFSIPLADCGGVADGSFGGGGGQVAQAPSDSYGPNGDMPWGQPAGPCSAPQAMPPYGRDMHSGPPAAHMSYYPPGMPPQEEAQGGFMQPRGGYPMKPPAACAPPPHMYGHHPGMPPGMPPQPHMDSGMPPMGGMPPYGGHQPNMMGYDPWGDGAMMGMPPPPHMQGMYDGRMHGYGGMPMDYGHGKRMMPEGGPPSASGGEWEDEQAQALKRPRLVWTPQLHKRFVDAVNQLGLKSAVPKTIMQLMNVEGLTRENVASHLQKYRLHLKRTTGTEEGEGTLGDFEGWEDTKHESSEKCPETSHQDDGAKVDNAGSGSKQGCPEEGGGGESKDGTRRSIDEARNKKHTAAGD